MKVTYERLNLHTDTVLVSTGTSLVRIARCAICHALALPEWPVLLYQLLARVCVFSASGTWEEREGQLYCQGHSQGWSDAFADNHANRDYADVYFPCKDWHLLVSGKSYRSTLTRVRQEAVESCFSGLEEDALPQHWRNFSDLMWKIERQLGIRRTASLTFLNQDPA